MKTIEDLKPGDYVAFGFTYNGSSPDQIIVDNITFIYTDSVLVHFVYGYKSLSETVKKTDIIAIENPDGKSKIEGWSGHFDILQPDNELLKEKK